MGATSWCPGGGGAQSYGTVWWGFVLSRAHLVQVLRCEACPSRALVRPPPVPAVNPLHWRDGEPNAPSPPAKGHLHLRSEQLARGAQSSPQADRAKGIESFRRKCPEFVCSPLSFGQAHPVVGEASEVPRVGHTRLPEPPVDPRSCDGDSVPQFAKIIGMPRSPLVPGSRAIAQP